MEWDWLVKTLKAGAWIARTLHAKKAVWRVRQSLLIGPLCQIHTEFIHSARKLAIIAASGNADLAAEQAFRICNASHRMMANFLELPPHQLHCCLKLIYEGDHSAPEDDKIGTWVRSEPFDDRPIALPQDDFHPIKNNSVWSALYGLNDGMTNWQRPRRCFACNDLPKRGEWFKCDRTNWQHWYRSALVFPIRYPLDAQGNKMLNIGFLAFDSPRTNVFHGLPDIFDYRESPSEYHDLLEASAVFHLGAIFADTMGTFLGLNCKGTATRDGETRLVHLQPTAGSKLPTPGSN